MRKKRRWIVWAILLLTAACACLGACRTRTDAPPAITVVSVEKTATDGTADTYTMTFSDGTTATFSVVNGTTGADGKSAFELYKRYNPQYAGTEEMWLDDLAKGKIDKDYVENAQCLVTLTVTDTDSNPIRGASVETGGYGYATGADGVCRILCGAERDLSMTVARYGYATVEKTVSAQALAAAGKNMTVAVALERTTDADGYALRRDEYLAFSALAGEHVAHYFWYFEYTVRGLTVTVDALDDEVYAGAETVGMNDNIEFVVGKIGDETGYSVGNSIDVLVELGADGMWTRRAVSADAFGENSLEAWREQNLLQISRVARSEKLDGWNGYTVEVTLDYALWDLDLTRARGNLTVLPSARNGDFYGNTAWRFYVGQGCIWQKANTAVSIAADGAPVEHRNETVDLEERLAASPAWAAGKTLAADMAEVESDALVRRFEDGAQLFVDRNYVLDGKVAPPALIGKSFLRGSIESPCAFTVRRAGYVAAATAENATATNAYLKKNGFYRIAGGLPVMGYMTATATKAYMSDGATQYFVKYCEQGESYALPAWSVVCVKEQDEYEADEWMTTAAEVTALHGALAGDDLPSTRTWQGIPGIEAMPKRDGGVRLWATWFTGGEKEPSVGNYALYYYSDDGGRSWTPAFKVAMPATATESRVFDPSVFDDGDGNLWLWWNQTNFRFGDISVWCAKVSNAADGDDFTVSQPYNTGTGLKLNKPIILSDGEWLYAAHDMTDNAYTYVYASRDKGRTWNKKGRAYVPNASTFHETAMVETSDERGKLLVMWNRCSFGYNVAIAYSRDGGATWSDSEEDVSGGPSSRINALKLESGNLLYAHHYKTDARNRLALSLSTDGGKTWPHNLVLDMRQETSYPDLTADGQGNIYVVWDFNRYADQQILMTAVSESELLAIDGVAVLAPARRRVISSLSLSGMQASIDGTVSDAAGAALSQATVTAVSPFGGSTAVVTDQTGRFAFADIDAEAYTLVVSKAGFEPTRITLAAEQYIDADFQVTLAPIALAAASYKTVSGTVTDGLTGLPIANATVTAGDAQTVTATDGTYAFTVSALCQTLTASADGYEAYAGEIGEVALLPQNTVDLGRVGGGAAVVFERAYLTIDGEGLTLTAFADRAANMNDGLSLSLNGATYSSGRSEKTLLVETFGNGYARVSHFPNGAIKQLGAGSGGAVGVTVDVADNRYTVRVPFTVFGACGYPQSFAWGASPFGMALTAGTKTGTAWSYVEWRYDDLPAGGYAGTVARGRTDTYVIVTPARTLVPYGEYYGDVWTTEAFDDYFATASGAAVKLSENMAAFDTTDRNVVLRAVADGGTMFSDRTTHAFNGKQPQMLGAMSMLYKSVTQIARVPVTEAGYLIMVVPQGRNVDGAWGDAVVTLPNFGYAIAADRIGCYVGYFEAGDIAVVPTDGLLFTNAVETEILVFGDSYTDAHVRGFWINWQTEMQPYGAKTIGISGSRIATPTAGDPLGWIERVRGGEVKAYRPRKILIHLGVNDIDNGVLGTDAAAQMIDLLRLLRAQLPDTQIHYTVIHSNIMFFKYAEQYRVFKDKIAKFAATDDGITLIDFESELYVEEDGLPILNRSLYRDGLHLSAAGYAIWVKRIYAAMGIAA